MYFFGENSYFNRPSPLPSLSPLPLLPLFELPRMTDTLQPPSPATSFSWFTQMTWFTTLALCRAVMGRCGTGTGHAGLVSVWSVFMVSIGLQSSGRGVFEVTIVLLQIGELVTRVKRLFVSYKLRNGTFLQGGKLSCLQRCEPTLLSHQSTRLSTCSCLSARQHHAAETRDHQAMEE